MVLAEWSSQADSSQEGRGTPRHVPPALVALYYFMPDEVSPGYQSLNDLGLQPVLPMLTLTHRAAHSALTVLNDSEHPHNVRLTFLAEVIMEAFTSERTPRLQPAPAERLVQKQRHINTGCVSWVQENI